MKVKMSWKAVILIGGPDKGTRFRPLSLDVPKPLFPIAGLPMVQHHIEACIKIPEIKEIFLIGFYPMDELSGFVRDMEKMFTDQEIDVKISYLPEYKPLGTAGGLYHFRDHLSDSVAFFVINSDVCCNFPLSKIMKFHQENAIDGITIAATKATSEESVSYGCVVEDETTHEATHYVEKPETFVSPLINSGAYVFSPKVLEYMKTIFRRNQEERFNCNAGDQRSLDKMSLETDILCQYAGTGKMFVFNMNDCAWGQIKSAASAIHANKMYLSLHGQNSPKRLSTNSENGPEIEGDVFIHPNANVHSSASLGPNVTIGPSVVVKAGARISNSIVLPGAAIGEHCCILNSIIGWDSELGAWTHVQGTAHQPDPNAPFSRIVSGGLFNNDGRLNPSITVLGRKVQVAPEIIVLNSIVLPNKSIVHSSKNQIIL